MRDHVWVGAADAPAWMARRHVHGDAPDPHAARALGPFRALRPGGHDRAGEGLRRAARRAWTSTTPRRSPPAAHDGKPVIPADAHIRLAAPSENDGLRILRRGYSFSDGIDPVTGELDAGLFFVAFQRDPRRQFIPLQQRLAVDDALNEYIEHEASARVRRAARRRGRPLTSAAPLFT